MIGLIMLTYHDWVKGHITLIIRQYMTKEACKRMMKDIREKCEFCGKCGWHSLEQCLEVTQ
jgi:hypothetical protein